MNHNTPASISMIIGLINLPCSNWPSPGIKKLANAANKFRPGIIFYFLNFTLRYSTTAGGTNSLTSLFKLARFLTNEELR